MNDECLSQNLVTNCNISSGIHESDNADGSPEHPWGLTFGVGELDSSGYWENGCHSCARHHEEKHGVPVGSYWPFPESSFRFDRTESGNERLSCNVCSESVVRGSGLNLDQWMTQVRFFNGRHSVRCCWEDSVKEESS